MPNDEDAYLHNYQDSLDTDPRMTDHITDEETDDPTEEFGVPSDEYKEELERISTEMETLDDDENLEAENRLRE